jgi:hypothetical protein
VSGEEVADGKMTLLSTYILDIHSFNENANRLSWDYTKSGVRQWLNGSFLNTAFKSAESDAIAPVDVTINMWYQGKKQIGDFTAVWGTGSPSAHTQAWPQVAYGDKVTCRPAILRGMPGIPARSNTASQ